VSSAPPFSRPGTERASQFRHGKKIERVGVAGKARNRIEVVIRFGPAGFLYKDWEGIVYPVPRPKKFDQLSYIAGYFDTVEINSSYYGPPTRSTATSWARRVSDNPEFRFTAKLWKRFTHERKTAWTRNDVKDVTTGFDVLAKKEKLGAVLLQFPWSFRRSDANSEWLGDVISTFRRYPLVLEVRHKSWLVPDLFQMLEDEGVGFVNIDQPMYRDSIGPGARVTSHVGYVRVHGRNYKDWFRKNAGVEQRYNYLYKAEELEPWADRVQEIADDPTTRDTYVVTNNHYRGKAVANALMLKSMVTGETAAGPPPLFGAYGAALEGYALPAGQRGG
jgi:uncharacterized protein YecE (DUF72 family)